MFHGASGSYMQRLWSIVMSIALYFIMIKVMPPEINTIEGGKDLIKEELHKLGPVTRT